MEYYNSIKIENHLIGDNSPVFIIAEVGQNHDGSLGMAHSFIDAAADYGAAAVKFQTHIAEAESTIDEKFRVQFSYEDATRYDYWKRMEFTPEQWNGLFLHAQERGIIFLSSVFSLEAVELLEKIGVPAWKIGSGEVNNIKLLSAILDTKKPILVSTGMSDWQEITTIVDMINEGKSPLALFQCTSRYPSKLEEVGLNVISEMKERFKLPVGLSDHSGTVFPSLAAMAQGANLIEVHVTFHSSMFGPDVPASLTFKELKTLVKAKDAFYKMFNHPVNKDQLMEKLTEMRNLFNKSVALKKDQTAGTILTDSMLTVKKPGTGIPATELDKCIGKTLMHDVASNRLLKWVDLI